MKQQENNEMEANKTNGRRRKNVVMRSMFYDVLTTITSSEYKLLEAVDYVLGRLVYETSSVASGNHR